MSEWPQLAYEEPADPELIAAHPAPDWKPLTIAEPDDMVTFWRADEQPAIHGNPGLEVLRTAPENPAPSSLPDGAYMIES
jgi:hypothetical protein